MATLLDLMKNPYKEYISNNDKYRYNEDKNYIETYITGEWKRGTLRLDYYSSLQYDENKEPISLKEIIANGEFYSGGLFILSDYAICKLYGGIRTSEILLEKDYNNIIKKTPMIINRILTVIGWKLPNDVLLELLKEKIFIECE